METHKNDKIMPNYLECVNKTDALKEKLSKGFNQRRMKYFVKHEEKILAAVGKWGMPNSIKSRKSDSILTEDYDVFEYSFPRFLESENNE